MKQILSTIFWGALVISVLVFYVIPKTSGVDVVATVGKHGPIASLGVILGTVDPVLVSESSHQNGKGGKGSGDDTEKEIVRTDRIVYLVAGLVISALLIYGLAYLFIRYRNKIIASSLVYYKAVPFGDFVLDDMQTAKGFLIGLSQNMKQPWDAAILGQPWFRYLIKKGAGDGRVEVYFGIPEDRIEPFINGFTGFYPRIQLVKINPETVAKMVPKKKHFKVSTFSLLVKDPLPIKIYEGKGGQPDPLNIIMAGMGGGKPSDIDVIVDILMKPVPEHQKLYKPGAQYIHKLKEERQDMSDIPGALLMGASADPKKVPKKVISEYEKDYLKAAKDRSTVPEKAFQTSIRLYATGDGEDDILMSLKSVSDSFAGTFTSFNSLSPEPVMATHRMRSKILEGRFGWKEGFILSTSELMGFVRIPDSTIEAFNAMDSIDARVIRAPQTIKSEETTGKQMYLLAVDEENSTERDTKFKKWTEGEIAERSKWGVSIDGEEDEDDFIVPASHGLTKGDDDSSLVVSEDEFNKALADFDMMMAATEPIPAKKPIVESEASGDDFDF